MSVIADNFLTGALLSMLLPIGLLILVVVASVVLFKRHSVIERGDDRQ